MSFRPFLHCLSFSLLILGLFTAPVSAESIVIGQCAPLSGSLSSTGKEMALGVRIAIDAANAAGGIGGSPLRHALKDDGYQTEETVRLTEELIHKEKAVALIGYAGTGNISELLKRSVLARGNIALIAPYTGGEPLRNPFNPWIFHIRASYGDETAAMVEQLVVSGIKRIGVFYQNDPFGLAGLAGVERALEKHGIQIVSKGSYEKNTEVVAPAVADIGKGTPQAVIMIGIVRPSAAFTKAYLAQYPGTQLFSISVINARDLYQLAGPSARGLGITQVMPSPSSSHLRIVRDYQQAIEKYGDGAAPSYTSFEEYVGARVLIEGIRAAGANPTPASVMKSLSSLSLNLGGFKLAFSPDNRVGSRFVDITLIGKDGNITR